MRGDFAAIKEQDQELSAARFEQNPLEESIERKSKKVVRANSIIMWVVAIDLRCRLYPDDFPYVSIKSLVNAWSTISFQIVQEKQRKLYFLCKENTKN